MKEGIKVSTDTVGRIKGYISADASAHTLEIVGTRQQKVM